jgi:hypothetical protein
LAYVSAILVTIIMIVGFSVIMMKFTGFWPCNIGEVFQVKDVSCDKNLSQNIGVILNSSGVSLPFGFPLLSLQNISQL